MVVDDAEFQKLRKDADDNRQIVFIVKLVVSLIIFCILFFSWGVRLIDLDIQRRTAEMQDQIELQQARVNKEVMRIESIDMSNEDYFKWLEVRNHD